MGIWAEKQTKNRKISSKTVDVRLLADREANKKQSFQDNGFVRTGSAENLKRFSLIVAKGITLLMSVL